MVPVTQHGAQTSGAQTPHVNTRLYTDYWPLSAHLARFYLFCLEFNSCSWHFMHLCHARHYSQEDMCIIEKEEV